MRSALLLLAVLLTGCSTTRTVTQTIPAEEPSLVLSTDTVAVSRLEPLPRGGVRTSPRQVRRAEETPDAPTLEVASITVGEGEVRVRSGSDEYVFQRPAHGETLQLRADTLDTIKGILQGKPTEQVLDVTTVEREAFLAVLWRYVQYVVGAVLVLVGLALLFRLSRLFS